MSLNEIAVDLTCRPEPFQPAQTDSFESVDEEAADSYVWRQSTSRRKSKMKKQPTYFVHSGMLRMAKAMGDIGKPVQLAVQEALYNNPGFGEFYNLISGPALNIFTDLLLCGHSLGAGVATILGLVSDDTS